MAIGYWPLAIGRFSLGAVIAGADPQSPEH